MLATAGYPTQTVSVGTTIFSEGDSGDRMYVVRSGTVEIVVGGQVVETTKNRGIFGEMAMIDGSPRSATVRAKEDSELVAINERGFIFLVHETPYFALDVMRTLADRLRHMNELV